MSSFDLIDLGSATCETRASYIGVLPETSNPILYFVA